jgi:hypothetical protein
MSNTALYPRRSCHIYLTETEISLAFCLKTIKIIPFLKIGLKLKNFLTEEGKHER